MNHAPKRPKTPYDFYVQLSGLVLAGFLFFVGMGSLSIIINSTNVTPLGQSLLSISGAILCTVATILVAIFSE